jgi:hypothetical protein
MARTAVAAGLVALGYDNAVALGAAQAADASNGNILSFNIANTPPTYGPFKVLLVVANGDASPHTVILRGSGYTGAANGAANSGIISPQNTVFAMSTLGDASYPVAAGVTSVIGPLTTDRFIQPNAANGGDLWIDWSAATSMTFWAYLLPAAVF